MERESYYQAHSSPPLELTLSQLYLILIYSDIGSIPTRVHRSPKQSLHYRLPSYVVVRISHLAYAHCIHIHFSPLHLRSVSVGKLIVA
jgi:hypothetical protein